MSRVKIISEVSELVPLLLSLCGPVKWEILNTLMKDWCTEEDIVTAHGEEAKDILTFLEKHKLVETMWQPGLDLRRTKAFRAYYNNVHINVACTLEEFSQTLSVAMLSDEDFKAVEERIVDMVGDQGMYFGDVLDEIGGFTSIEFKSMIKRSTLLEYRGHRVRRIQK